MFVTTCIVYCYSVLWLCNFCCNCLLLQNAFNVSFLPSVLLQCFFPFFVSFNCGCAIFAAIVHCCNASVFMASTMVVVTGLSVNRVESGCAEFFCQIENQNFVCKCIPWFLLCDQMSNLCTVIN